MCYSVVGGSLIVLATAKTAIVFFSDFRSISNNIIFCPCGRFFNNDIATWSKYNGLLLYIGKTLQLCQFKIIIPFSRLPAKCSIMPSLLWTCNYPTLIVSRMNAVVNTDWICPHWSWSVCSSSIPSFLPLMVTCSWTNLVWSHCLQDTSLGAWLISLNWPCSSDSVCLLRKEHQLFRRGLKNIPFE